MNSAESIIKALNRIHQLTKSSKAVRIASRAKDYFRLFLYKIDPREKIFNVKTILGTSMKILMPSSQDIFLFGCKTHDSEIRLAKYLVYELPKHKMFVDVGAHFGFFTLLATKAMSKDAHIIAIEPSATSFRILKENCKHLPQITIHNIALSNQNEVVHFVDFPVKYLEYNALDHVQYKDEEWYKDIDKQTVKTTAQKGDDLFGTRLKPDLIKIDVEGAEKLVLAGLEKTIDHSEPIIILEIQAQSKVHKEAISMLLAKFYRAHWINNKGELDLLEDDFMITTDSENIVFKSYRTSQS